MALPYSTRVPPRGIALARISASCRCALAQLLRWSPRGDARTAHARRTPARGYAWRQRRVSVQDLRRAARAPANPAPRIPAGAGMRSLVDGTAVALHTASREGFDVAVATGPGFRRHRGRQCRDRRA